MNPDPIQSCLSLTPIAHLTLSLATFRTLWESIQSVRWNQQQSQALATFIAELLYALDTAMRAPESRISVEIDTFQTLIKDINSFVQGEQGRDFLKLLFTKDERIAGIENYHRRLCACAVVFQITPLLDIQGWQKRIDEAREADKQALDDRLTELEANQIKLKDVLDVQQNNMVAMMTSLQKAIIKRLCGERERRFFSSTLVYLAETSGQHVPEIESWMVTAFDVEFGPEIGSGGFGQVYKGVWNRTQVALKVLKTDAGATPSLALIRRELRTWSALLHPHILQFLGANVFDDRPFIVMPFLKNGNARDYVNDHPDCNRVMILHHISLGLVYLHHNNVIHGDLKALNVLIDDAGHAVLCDFGLSRIKNDATTRSIRQRVPTVAGSRNWMSPERIMGGALRKPVDVYAFGMTMFEILTGQVPLGHIEYVDFIHLVVDLNVRPERPEDDLPFKISNGLWSLAESCWAKSPQYRPSALAICDAISSILASHSDASIMTSVANSATSSTMLQGAPPKYESGPLPSSPMYYSYVPSAQSQAATSTTVSSGSLDGRPFLTINGPSTFSDASSYSETSGKSTTPNLHSRALPQVPTGIQRPTRIPVSQINDAEPMYTGRFVYKSTDPVIDISARPNTAGTGAHRTAPDAAGRLPSVPERPMDSTQTLNADEASVVDESYNTPSPLPASFLNQPRTSRETRTGISTAQPSSNPNDSKSPLVGHTKQVSEHTIPEVGERPHGFGRVKNWFGRRPSTAPDNSGSPLRYDISGFRILPSRFSLPRAKSRLSEMWSLDDLIDRWIERSSELTKDEEFQDIFLTTYTAFTTCRKVFELLRKRFDAAANGDGPAQARAFRRHSIICAIIYWVSTSFRPVDPDVLSQMKEFASSVTSSLFMGAKAKGIIAAIDQHREEYSLPPASASPTKLRALLDNTPEELAMGLTTLEGVMYSRIRPADYVRHIKQVQAPNRVADALVTTRKITFWVKQKVLRSEMIKTRGKAFKFFIKTAEACQAMRNYSSMAAIITALESDIIQCLSETLEELAAEDQKLLATLSNFVKSEHAYRMAVNSSEDPCVLRLDFHLHDLQAMLPSVLPNARGKEPVNLVGCMTLATSLRDVAKFKLPPLEEVPSSEVLLYLMKQLDVIQVSARANDELRQRSRYVKAQEQGFRGSRARALKNSGFV